MAKVSGLERPTAFKVEHPEQRTMAKPNQIKALIRSHAEGDASRSRLEQRIGRIKRFGQARNSVDMLNLVYHGTRDKRVYERLSERMRDRYGVNGAQKRLDSEPREVGELRILRAEFRPDPGCTADYFESEGSA